MARNGMYLLLRFEALNELLHVLELSKQLHLCRTLPMGRRDDRTDTGQAVARSGKAKVKAKASAQRRADAGAGVCARALLLVLSTC